MAQKRNMPSKEVIADFWNDNVSYSNFSNDSCWGCGFLNVQLQRAHIKARASGGTDSADNLILLCKFCHDHIQESMCHNKEGVERLISGIKDGMPFFRIRFVFMAEKIKADLYRHSLHDMGISEKDYDIVRNHLLTL